VDVQYTLNGITFEWDRHKAASHQRKHRITFELACEAFFDPFVYFLDEEVIDGEHRETIVGFTSKWRLLLVVYVMRANSIRIISARLATNAERGQYENQ
jgi:uncharacterized DUF497 family protein